MQLALRGQRSRSRRQPQPKTMQARGKHRQAKHGQNVTREVSKDLQKDLEPDPRKRFGAGYAWVQLLPTIPGDNAGWTLARQPDKGLVDESIRPEQGSRQPSRHSSPSSAQSPSSEQRRSTRPYARDPGFHPNTGSSVARGAGEATSALSNLLAPVKAYVDGNVEQGEHEVVCLHW